ncbi:MAG: hypothetical protein FWD87_09430 [Spirochaetaceae bacterium]|nr:hypothetical protein [Spirochaetaceae bacterium]
MQNNKIKMVFLLFILLLVISGCGRAFRAEVPSGFAVSKENRNFLIYSPDGFKMGVKTERNNPRRDLLFWYEALKTHLGNNGYFLFDETSFNSVNLEWKKITWLMPMNHDYYKYMTAVAVKGRRIYIVEATGEQNLFNNYEEDIKKIISSISARR